MALLYRNDVVDGIGLLTKIQQNFIIKLTEGLEGDIALGIRECPDADQAGICMERIYARYSGQERQRVILTDAEESADGKPAV